MPPRKVRHSLRVANMVSHLPKKVRYAAAFHDYLERGGDISALKGKLHKDTINLVKLLTSDDNDDPLTHIKKAIKGVNPDLKNFLILIKMADRKDNFEKRKRQNKLTKKYKDKTLKLISFLLQNYSGDPKLMDKLL